MKRTNKQEKNNVLKSAGDLFNVREDIVGFFQKGIFPFKGNVFKTKEEIKEKTKEEIERFISNGIALIEREWKSINNDLCKKHFDFLTPIDLAKNYLRIKDANKNSKPVEEITNRWSNLKDKIKETSKEEIKNEKPNVIRRIINDILNLNKEVQEQRGSGLKMLTPDQMLSRLRITLPQLNAGNN